LDRLDREFKLLAASADRTARVQRDEATYFLETSPGATGGPSNAVLPTRGHALARHLQGAYDALIGHVDRRVTEYETLPDSKSKSGAITEMRQMVAGARNLQISLDWLDAAASPPLDLGTRYLVDQVAARLVAEHAEVTVVSATDRSYATVTNPLRPVFEMSGQTPPEASMVIVVFVPRREQRSGLLHPLIVHELGHAANKQHDLVSRVLQTTDGSKQLSALTDEARKLAEAASSRSPTSDEITAEAEALAMRLTAWVEEAICDSIASHILGPTYLYSFMAIVGTSDLDLVGDEHPTTRQRIRLILRQLDVLGWAELLVEAAPEIDSWFREASTQEPDRDQSDEDFCATALNALARPIVDVVAAHLNDMVLTASDFAPVKAEIADLLNLGIPPSQTRGREAIGRAQIILGSWLFAVKRQGENLDALAVAPDVPELSRLLPKALQDAAVLEAWSTP
jgi:hypothetical protein